VIRFANCTRHNKVPTFLTEWFKLKTRIVLGTMLLLGKVRDQKEKQKLAKSCETKEVAISTNI